MDLKEITLVDRDAVAVCGLLRSGPSEAQELPGYIREWDYQRKTNRLSARQMLLGLRPSESGTTDVVPRQMGCGVAKYPYIW